MKEQKKYWAPRGTIVHSAFESFLNRDSEHFIDIPKEWDKYEDWIYPLLQHQYVSNDFQAIATEFTVCDRKNGIAGTFDAFGYDQRTNKYVLVDLKTQRGVWIDECRTIWCRPEKTVVGEYQDVSTCLEAWHSKLDFWKMMQEEF